MDRARTNTFNVGEIVFHVRYGYRGVVFAYDHSFRGGQEWYQKNRTQPRKDQPWYHVLVNGESHTTYVAEENLIAERTGAPIKHPLLERFFATYHEGRYYVCSIN